MKDLFFIATIKKYRFEAKRGMLTTEDVATLPLTTTVPHQDSLDSIAISLHKKITAIDEQSFVKSKKKTGIQELRNKLDIVKSIIEYRQEELEKAAARKVNADRNEKLKKRLEDIDNEDINKMSKEDIHKELGYTTEATSEKE
jgi:hypothetical protein